MNRFIKATLQSLGLCALLSACGDTKVNNPDTNVSENTPDKDAVFCDSLYAEGAHKKEVFGSYQYVFQCKNGSWNLADSTRIVPEDQTSTPSTLPSTVDTTIINETPTSEKLCDDKFTPGSLNTVLDYNHLFTLMCQDNGTWETIDVINLDQQSSSSSAQFEYAHSATTEPKSSSSFSVDISGTCIRNANQSMYWCGEDLTFQVETGLDNGSDESGYWFTENDEEKGGESTIAWPVVLGNEYDDQSLAPVISHCNGLCGTAVLRQGVLSSTPFVNLGFLVAGPDKNGKADVADASSWGGVCISYASKISAYIEMGANEETSRELGFDLPSVTLPEALSPTSKCFSWDNFKQQGWGEKEITGEELSHKLAAVRIVFRANTDTNADFYIFSISSNDTKQASAQQHR